MATYKLWIVVRVPPHDNVNATQHLAEEVRDTDADAVEVRAVARLRDLISTLPPAVGVVTEQPVTLEQAESVRWLSALPGRGERRLVSTLPVFGRRDDTATAPVAAH